MTALAACKCSGPDHGDRWTPLYGAAGIVRFGSLAAYDLIADAAKLLDQVFRESDVVARVGGDEFAVFAVLDEHDGAGAFNERLAAAIDRFNAQAVPSMRISMSIGIEELPSQSATPLDVLLSRAGRSKRGRTLFPELQLVRVEGGRGKGVRPLLFRPRASRRPGRDDFVSHGVARDIEPLPAAEAVAPALGELAFRVLPVEEVPTPVPIARPRRRSRDLQFAAVGEFRLVAQPAPRAFDPEHAL